MAAWRLFKQDPEAAHAIAFAVLPLGPTTVTGMPNSLSGSAGEYAIVAKPSRGPAPFAGTFFMQRAGASEKVYLMILDGPAQGPIGDKCSYIKVGRSADTVRREAELNGSFPPGLGLLWRTIHSLGPFDPVEAHGIEQEILSRLAVVGLTVGGEFARGEPEDIRRIANAVLVDFRASNPLPTPCAPANALLGLGRGGRNDHVQRT